MTVLITTTINVPGNLERWRGTLADDDVVIVAGDLKSPHDDIERFIAHLPGENVYLRPEAQERWRTSEAVGWNCVQRRNVALLEALRLGHDVIITVDDDNYPTSDTQVREYEQVLRGDVHPPRIHSYSGWFDPGQVLLPQVTHRGYPADQRGLIPRYDVHTTYVPNRVVVAASLWFGDPDVDAVERWHFGGRETRSLSLSSFTLAPGTWAPFNSQATAFTAELTPALLMWPHVGRYDDIWASYLARAVCDVKNWTVHYGEPAVVQVRNEHDVLRDLEAELHGMRYTPTLTVVLRQISKNLIDSGNWKTRSVRDLVEHFFYLLASLSLEIIPEGTRRAWEAWLADVDVALEEANKR